MVDHIAFNQQQCKEDQVAGVVTEANSLWKAGSPPSSGSVQEQQSQLVGIFFGASTPGVNF